MSRNLLRSDYGDGETAWLDWFIVAVLVVNGLSSLLVTGDERIAGASLVAGLSLGFVLVLVELEWIFQE